MAYKKIQFKRGTKTGMPVLRSGEPGFTQDEKSLYIGDGTANQRFLNEVQVGTKIDEKIAPVTQSITNNVAALNESITSNITTVNQAITDKAKINGEATNVNFIENKVAQNGLVGFKPTTISSTGTLSLCGVYKINLTNPNAFNLTDTSGNRIYLTITGTALKLMHKINSETFSQTVIPSFNFIEGVPYYCIFSIDKNIFKYVISLFGQIKAVGSIDTINSFEMTSVGYYDQYYYVYNRILTSQEIQHNLSVLNNTPSINKINDYAISTDTDHIQDRTGRVQDTINRVFYKNNCKEFTSNGTDIVVNNGMDGYVLSGAMQGQTVNNIVSSCSVGSIGLGSASNRTATVKLLPSTKYTIITSISNMGTKNIDISINNGVLTSYTIANNGITTKTITTQSTHNSEDKIWIYYTSTVPIEERVAKLDWIVVLEGEIPHGIITNNIPFGLTSTQATITNNGLKYSFYSSLEDKLANRVIDLGGMEGARNGLEIKEDGSGVYTQSSIHVVLNGSESGWNQVTNSTTGKNMYRLRITNLKLGSSNKGDILCDKISVLGSLDNWNNDVNSITVADSLNDIRLKILEAQTLTDFKSYLQSNNVTVRYQLATPIVTTIDKSLVPTILTQATNTFQFGEAVAPYKVTIQAPVNRIAEMQAEINEIKALIQTPSNINLTMNYIEDEYNKNQSEEGAI